jgi:hypothetical protein
MALATSTVSGAQTASALKEMASIAGEAYLYGFPMIVAYKVLYQFNVDRNSGQFKATFNQINNEARVFTPKDTTITTPNSDTPYSMVQLDLRAEPIVLCMPAIDQARYYDVQFVDMYTDNYAYVGTRTTGNGAGCYAVAGPDWKGETPKGIAKLFRSETQFSLVIYRTQLFNPADTENVKHIQAGYKVQPLSAFLSQPAPPPVRDQLAKIRQRRFHHPVCGIPELPTSVLPADRDRYGGEAVARTSRPDRHRRRRTCAAEGAAARDQGRARRRHQGCVRENRADG